MPLPLQPQVTVAKSSSTTQIVPGADVVYAIEVANTGVVVAPAVTVTDTLPAGLTSASSPDGCTSADGVTVTSALGDLPVGAVVTVTVVASAADPFPAGDVDGEGMVPNTARVTSPDSNCPPGDAPVGEACESTAGLPVLPTLTIAKSAGVDQVVPGGEVRYRIDVANTGPVVAPDVLLTDPLPVGLTFVSADNPSCTSADGRVVTCALGDLAPGATASVNLVTRAADPLPPEALGTRPGAVPNTAGMSRGRDQLPDPHAGPAGRGRAAGRRRVVPQAGEQCTSTVTVPVPPVLEVDKSTPATSITPGGQVPYVITVTNTGMVPATAVTATDTLPEGLTFMRSQAPVCTNGSGRDVVCAVGDLAVGQSVSIMIMTRAADPFPSNGGTVVNIVTIEGQGSNCVSGSTDSRCRDAAMLPDPASAAAGPLPRTGTDIARTVAVALLAVATGALLLALTRRRRARHRIAPAAAASGSPPASNTPHGA